jgi:hypothetical protein
MAIGGPGDGVLETMDLDPELVHDLGLYELHDEFIDGDPLGACGCRPRNREHPKLKSLGTAKRQKRHIGGTEPPSPREASITARKANTARASETVTSRNTTCTVSIVPP